MNLLEHNTSIYEHLVSKENLDFYENGAIKSCMLSDKNTIKTGYGNLIPKYSIEGETVRRKYTNSISFHKDGSLKSVHLEEQTEITTSIGVFPAELLTFYESGALKRIFPINGKISGYWTEEDEETLCSAFRFSFPFGNFLAKVINLNFYESGRLKSMTLWPGQIIYITTKFGKLPVKTGFSLFEDGSLKSVEPAYETTLSTSIGDISAFDVSSLGINGDNNSLCFDKDGNIQSLVTSSCKIVTYNNDGTLEVTEPALVPDPILDGQYTVIPVKINFKKDYVKFEARTVRIFDIYKTKFRIESIDMPAIIEPTCGDCSKCNSCCG